MKYLLLPFVLLYKIFEEFGWKRVGKPVYIKIKELKLIIRLHVYLNSIENRYILLVIFMIPFVISEILSLLAIGFITKGLIVQGLISYSFKLLLMIPIVTIFKSGRQQLLSFYMIKFFYILLINIKRSKIYRNANKNVNIVINKIKGNIC